MIPCLLLRNAGLVKTVRFKDPTYIGDPINAVRIFNEKEVDELMFLDITATARGEGPPLKLLSEIASECFMPLGYGGGVRSLADIEAVLRVGVEKVCINTAAISDPALIERAADTFGSQSIVVGIDARTKRGGGYETATHGATRPTGYDAGSHARQAVDCGAGEIFVNSVDRDGTMAGFDLDLIQSVVGEVGVPVIACGGAGKVTDLVTAIVDGGAAAVATGSLVVFHGKHRAVLINFPTRNELLDAFASR